MVRYKKNDARAWARDNMKGVANVVIPSFSRDLKRLNEKGIRFDIRKEIEFGFWGTLLVSEVAITVPEYVQFTQWARDPAALATLHEALRIVTLCLAPFTPFITERVWQDLFRSTDADAPASSLTRKAKVPAPGAVRSTITTVTGLDGSLTFPARSVALAVIWYVPVASVVGIVNVPAK